MIEWTAWHERHKDKIELVPGIDCWIWTAGASSKKQGAMHGRVRFTNRNGGRYSEYAHRAAYISLSGWPKKDSMICHKCGVGLCVRPSHLYEGTAKTNGKDMSEMGTGSSLLTYAQAYDVRLRYKNGEPLAEIAQKYKIAFGSVYPIVMGKSYKHAPFPENYKFGKRAREPLTEKEVEDIRNMLRCGITQREISKKHNITQSIVSRINTGTRHVSK